MSLHFSKEEFNQRTSAVVAELRHRGLDGILLFRQESMYYLTGYDTFGYCFFQCAYLDASGKISLITRRPDMHQAQVTSTIDDIRVWVDQEGKKPVEDLLSMLDDYKCRGKRLGVELNAYGLTAELWSSIEPSLSEYCQLENASDIVSKLRVVKSSSEIEYAKRAAELADDALDEAIRLTAPGAFEGDILAAMHGAIYRGGGDDPANEFILGSGENALLCRYVSGRRHLSEQDQLTLEFAGVYRHYHSCLMRTIIIGEPDPRQLAMHQASVEAMQTCQDAVKVGSAMGDVFDAHARVMDEHGFREQRMNACGYSLGTTYAPTWMDWPMFYTGNSVIIEPNMVFFIHMILFDTEKQFAMTLGETVLVEESGVRRLSRHNLDLITA